jgi:DNA primase
MFPENDILLPICNMFDKIVIFFDNDTTGINASQHLCNYINNYFDDKCTSVHLPESLLDENIYDASDMIKYKKQKELITFLEQNTL